MSSHGYLLTRTIVILDESPPHASMTPLLVTSSQTPFPDKVIFWGTGDLSVSFGGDIIQPITLFFDSSTFTLLASDHSSCSESFSSFSRPQSPFAFPTWAEDFTIHFPKMKSHLQFCLFHFQTPPYWPITSSLVRRSVYKSLWSHFILSPLPPLLSCLLYFLHYSFFLSTRNLPILLKILPRPDFLCIYHPSSLLLFTILFLHLSLSIHFSIYNNPGFTSNLFR